MHTLKQIKGMLKVAEQTTNVESCREISIILFILQVNPASFLLEDVEGYQLGNKEIKQKLNHLFFVGDLKLYATDIDTGKLLLDIITTFTKDVGMSFGEKKCAYICTENGKRKSLGQTIEINGLRAQVS